MKKRDIILSAFVVGTIALVSEGKKEELKKEQDKPINENVRHKNELKEQTKLTKIVNLLK